MKLKGLMTVLLPAFFAISPVLSAATPKPAHLIVSVHGQAEIQRRGNPAWAPVFPGTAAERGDLLRLGNGARLTLVCSDLKKHELAGPRQTGVPCVQARPVLVHGHEAWSPTRGASPSDRFPILLSPRRTKVRDGRPVLRWTAVPGAVSYLVRVRGNGIDWSAEVESRTELAYPESAPALAPGSAYRVIVASPDGRSSEEEGQSGLGFTLLDSEERTALEAEEERVRSLGLAPEETRFVLAHLHASRDLRAEAIDDIQALGSPPTDPAAARMLGDLYTEAGLGRHAEESYLMALRLSRAAADPEGEASVLERLGTFYDLVLGNRSEATARWREAAVVYRRLGDAQAVKRLEDLLAAREPAGSRKEKP